MATSAPELFLKLHALNPLEPNITWENFCQNPMDLFRAFASMFVVDATSLKSTAQVVLSSTVPTAEQRTAIWIKTSWPYGIGVFLDGKYRMDYGLSGYTANQPFLHVEATMPSPMPGYVTKLTDTEITQYGLQNTTGSHANKMAWYMFSPPAITV